MGPCSLRMGGGEVNRYDDRGIMKDRGGGGGGGFL